MQILANLFPKKIGLVGHTIINYPNHEDAKKIVATLVASGVDLIELQIPFSEPIADGPIFVKASQVVIDHGITLKQCYEFMQEMTERYSIPFVFMTYANMVFKQGYEQFVKAAKESGAQGAIVPDLPLDVAQDYRAICQHYEFSPISVVAPNMSAHRLQTLATYLDGFVYAVARAGVTGSKTKFDATLDNYLATLRQHTSLPIAIGFGVTHQDDVKFLRGKADYAVVGTETIRAYERAGIEGVASLWQELARGCA